MYVNLYYFNHQKNTISKFTTQNNFLFNMTTFRNLSFFKSKNDGKTLKFQIDFGPKREVQLKKLMILKVKCEILSERTSWGLGGG